MVVTYYQNETDYETGSGPIVSFFNSLKKERPPKLWSLVREMISKIQNKSDLRCFEETGIISRLQKTIVPLYEIKIPKTNKNGVVRLYFAYKKGDKSTIFILSAEKKKRKESNKNIIRQAEKRYKEVCL